MSSLRRKHRYHTYFSLKLRCHSFTAIIKLTQFIGTKGYLDLGLTGLHSRVRLGMHCKMEKKESIQWALVPITLSSDELCSVYIAPFLTSICNRLFTRNYLYDCVILPRKVYTNQACRNPRMLDYRNPVFSYNFGQLIILSANVASICNSRLQHSGVSANLI